MRRRKNLIKLLVQEDGNSTEDIQTMKDMVNSFYGNLYTSEGVHDMEEVLNTVPVKATVQMNEQLNALYTAEEVKTALFQMAPTKAPGSAGFPAHFFQHHWEICGEEVARVVLGIVSGKESAKEINNTVLVLILKVKTLPCLHNSGQLVRVMYCIRLHQKL